MRRLVKFTEAVAALLLIGMLISITAQIVARLVGIDLDWTDEAARLLMTWMIFIGSAALVAWGGHISIEVLIGSLKGRTLTFFNAFIGALIFLCIIFVLWLSIELIQRPTIINQRTPMLRMPILYIYLALPVSFTLMAIFFVASLKKSILGDDLRDHQE